MRRIAIVVVALVLAGASAVTAGALLQGDASRAVAPVDVRAPGTRAPATGAAPAEHGRLQRLDARVDELERRAEQAGGAERDRLERAADRADDEADAAEDAAEDAQEAFEATRPELRTFDDDDEDDD